MLERINKTNDVRKLNLDEKKILANEIRDYILDITSKNGGHVASNLGVVELTIALESVFNLKKDKIVWDVGHQCYTHKILNGRKDSLKTLRQLNGISGFPKTEESYTDCFNTGHSSTSISAALGMALARDVKKKDNNVIAVIGDGALTGGMALEALNHVGESKTKMLIILNDNEMSISENIGGINNLLTRLRSKKNYRSTNNKMKGFVFHIPVIGKTLTKIIRRIKKGIKQLVIPGMYFEEIGIRYLGPVDGHNIEELECIFNKAKELDGPTLIHVLTKKGNGYKFAMENPSKFHGVGPFNKETGELLSKGGNSYSKVFGNKLVSLAKKDKRIVAITAAMKDGTGLSSFADIFPNRYFDVGIAEQHALTFAAGLAKDGLVPFISIYSSFYQRGYDQVIHDICNQNLHVIMCVDRAGLVGEDGNTHQGLYDLAFFKLIPNIVILSPSDFNELESMMEFALSIDKPVVIRYPKGNDCNSLVKHKKISLGKSEVLRNGNDITLIGLGNTVSKCLSIADKVSNKSIEVINTRFLKPLDKDIIKSIKKTRNVIVVEDGTIISGLSTSIKDLIVDNKIEIDSIKCFAYPDEFINHGKISELEKKYKVDEKSIIKYIDKL